MTTERRTLPIHEYRLHGTGDPTVDTANVNRLVAAIERMGSGVIVSSGDVHYDAGAFVNAAGGWKMLPGSKLHLYPGAYFGWGTDFTDPVFDIGTIPLTANGAAGDHTIRVASGALDVGDYITIAADNEYQTPYTQHLEGIESRPLMLRRVIRAFNSTTYELDKPLVDDLTSNPRCQVMPMLSNVVLENFRWTFHDDSGASTDLFTEDYMGFHKDSLASLNSTYPGDDTDSWGAVRSGNDKGIYRWNGSQYVKERDLPAAAGLLFEKVTHLRMAGCEHVAPAAGSIKMTYVHDGLIEGMNYGEKFASWYSKSDSGYGYGLLFEVVEKMRVTSSNFDVARHCITSGGVGIGGHRYGNGAIEVDNCKFHNNGGGESALPCDLHSEIEGGVFRDNEFVLPETGNHNHASISSRSRNTVMKGNDFIGPGGDKTIALRAIEPLGPNQIIEGNTFRGIAIGIRLKPTEAFQSINGLKVTRNTFEDINHCALGIEDGVDVDFEFSNNICHDVGHVAAGGGYFGGIKACVIFDGASTGERRIYGNVMPRYRNDYGIHFGTVSPAGDDKIECNIMTNYGTGVTGQSHFGGDGSNTTQWAQAFSVRNFTDEFYDDYLAAVPAGSSYANETHTIASDGASVTTTKQFSSAGEFAVLLHEGRELIPTVDYTYDTETKEINWSADVATHEATSGRTVLVKYWRGAA